VDAPAQAARLLAAFDHHRDQVQYSAAQLLLWLKSAKPHDDRASKSQAMHCVQRITSKYTAF
jgi:hypothetical protein